MGSDLKRVKEEDIKKNCPWRIVTHHTSTSTKYLEY